MTVEELIAREAIRDTLAAYTLAGDRGRHDAFLRCFAEGACYRSDIFRLNGRAAIRAWLESFRAGAPDVQLVRHHLSTSRIVLDGPGEARARTYYLAVTERGPDHGGAYVDRFRRVGDDWLIAERDVRLDWARPDSRFVPAAAMAALRQRRAGRDAGAARPRFAPVHGSTTGDDDERS